MNQSIRTRSVVTSAFCASVQQTKFLGLLVISMILLACSTSSLATPADTTWMKGKYGIFVQYLRGVNDISGDNSGSWNTTLYAFNTDTFAQQVNATGASYVVFALGQCDGYYTMGSSTFTSVTGQTGYAGRNLLLDIYNSLHNPANTGGVAKDIKLLVYLASEGPSSAPYAISGPSGFNCENGLGPQHADFRAKFNAMIKEISDGLGGMIAGWWLDGTWSYWQVGYDANWNPVYTNPADGSVGLNNLNALITACRSGNPNAVVACNSPITSTL